MLKGNPVTMASFQLPTEPEALLNFMDDIDTDESDSDFDTLTVMTKSMHQVRERRGEEK